MELIVGATGGVEPSVWLDIATRKRPANRNRAGELTWLATHLMIIRPMRISAIDVDLIPLPAVSPAFAWRRGLRGSRPARTTAVLRIRTESGAVGEAYHDWSGPMLADIVDSVL